MYYFPYFLPFLFNKYFFCMPGSCHKHSREEEMILQVQFKLLRMLMLRNGADD